jgi:hypothetical protein
MEYTDIFVTASVADAQQWLAYLFSQEDFTLEWHDAYNGQATRGSEGANFALGAWSQYYRIDFQLIGAPDGGLAIRLYKMNSGWMGGVIGAHKVKKQYGEIVEMVARCFETQGCYRGRAQD